MFFGEKKNMGCQLQEFFFLRFAQNFKTNMWEFQRLFIFSSHQCQCESTAPGPPILAPNKPAQRLLIDSDARLAARTDIAEHADIIAGCQREGKAARRNVLYWMAHVIVRSFQERGRGE